MPSDTRQRLMTAAFELFNRHGFNAVGLDRLLDEVGVTKTTFYNHFSSKDDLIVAVLDHYCDQEEREMLDQLRRRAGFNARGQLEAMFELLDGWMREPDFRGCIFVTAAAEYPSRHHPVHESAARQKERWRAIYRQLAQAAGARDPDLLADQFSLLVEGAVVLRHVSGDLQAARKAAQAAAVLIDAQLPPATPVGVCAAATPPVSATAARPSA